MCALNWEFVTWKIVYPGNEAKRYGLHGSGVLHMDVMNSEEANGINPAYYTQPALSSDRSRRSGDLRGGRGGWRDDR